MHNVEFWGYPPPFRTSYPHFHTFLFTPTNNRCLQQHCDYMLCISPKSTKFCLYKWHKYVNKQVYNIQHIHRQKHNTLPSVGFVFDKHWQHKKQRHHKHKRQSYIHCLFGNLHKATCNNFACAHNKGKI